MASAPDPRRQSDVATAAFAVLLTALLSWFGTGLDPWWPLLWFAPLPALLFSIGGSRSSAALVAGLGWLLGNLNLWQYFHEVLRVPAGTLASILGAETLLFTVAVLLFRALVRRGAHWRALLAFPAFWVSCEYLLSLSSPHGTAGNLAYSQLEFLPFLQLASVTGPWGMSFALLLLPAALAVAWRLRETPRTARRVLATALTLIGLALAFGAKRLAMSPRGAPGRSVKVGLIASDAAENVDVAGAGAPTARLFRGYAAQVAALAAQGAKVAVLPEKLGVVVDAEGNGADALFQTLADSTGVDIVVGMIRVAPPRQYNQARVYVPAAPPLTYDKQHMLPPFESELTPGTGLTLMPRSSGMWGVAICKDMDFPGLSRRYGEAGAGLLLVPAWDFVADRISHGHMAILRGVESGFAIARSARQGYLTVSDNRGRILAEVTSDSAPFATLLVDVPTAHESTIYSRFGDWFAWVALAAFGLALTGLRRAS